MKVKILISIFILAASSVFAKTNHWNIILAHGDTISNVSLQQLDKDSLTISGEEFTQSVPIDSIMELRKPRKPSFLKGAGIGTLTGTIFGSLLGAATYSDSKSSDGYFDLDFGPGLNIIGGGLAGGVVGFFVGGIIGSSDKDKVYNLSQKTPIQKYNTIKWIISKEL
jgi:hypothetical protein